LAGTIQAVQHVRRMRGGAQSHLMRCDDGHFYVVKFQNNPQHLRVLANELLATLLAERVALSVPVPRVVEVSPWLVRHTPELRIQLAGSSEPCAAGKQFGARFVVDPFGGQALDYLPEEQLDRVANLREFGGMLCLDKWTGNTNGRQAVFVRRAGERRYRAVFIDQGYCFNAGEWEFTDSALRGVYALNKAYEHVDGWDALEPWLSNIETLRDTEIEECAGQIPPEWMGDPDDLDRLVDGLKRRRSKVRELITSFRQSARQPFPSWREQVVVVQ
jgi:hypothetical protein